MKKRLFLLIAFIAPFLAWSQKSPAKFGSIPMDEVTMSRYNPDTSAAAVILFDYGEAYISFGASAVSLNFERHTRIKILNKDGVGWADVLIRLFESGSAEEKISGLKAAAYNLEGGKIVESKLSKDGIFREKFNKNINQVKFTIPNTKEGSVIEFTYKVSSPFLANFPNWQFQYKIPSMHSEYWAIIPEFFSFQKYMQGYLAVSNYEVKPSRTGDFSSDGHHWTIKNVPAFKPEPHMTSEDDYVSKINFALSHFSPPGGMVQNIMGSWEKMNSNFLQYESFGKALKGSGFLKKTVDEITAGLNSPEEKIAAIHAYVRGEIEWNGTKDYLTSSIRKILDEKKGTSGDINLTLGAMLDKAGIPVQMVLLSTRDHGFIRQEYPMEKQFNYVVCEVPFRGKKIMIDATERYLPLHVLPERCLNQVGFRISDNNPGWVEIQPAAKSRTVVSAELTLKPDGELQGAVAYLLDGYEAGNSRRKYINLGEAEYLKNSFNPTWDISNSTFEGVLQTEEPMKSSLELVIPDHAVVAGDIIYINPFVTLRMKENPFKLETREYPVDFGSPIEKIYTCSLTIPDGYEVDEMPQSKIMALPQNAGRYLVNVTQTGNKISFTSSFQINKNLFAQNEYPFLREFYNQIVAKEAEQIVLKKKTN